MRMNPYSVLYYEQRIWIFREGKFIPGMGEFRSYICKCNDSINIFSGSLAASFAAFPAFDAMRQALPMVHAFMLMAVIIITPLVIVMSGYSLKTLVTLTFVSFALVSLTFWWELARWLDSGYYPLYMIPVHIVE